MRNYETIVILDTELTEEVQKGLIEKIKGEIEGAGGTVENVDEWGKKRLAYPINFKTDGYYVYIEFTGATSLPQTLERVYRITEGIVKGLVVKVENN